MPVSSLNEFQEREVARLLKEGMSWGKIAKAIGSTKPTVQRAVVRIREGKSVVAADDDMLFRENADGTATASGITTKPIRTLKEAIAAAGVDESIWFVDRWESGAWTTGMKLKGGKDEGDTVAQVQQYRVRLYLKRIVSRSMQQALDSIYERIQRYAPSYQSPKIATANGKEQFLGVIALFDAHFGKLCWAKETGSDYDLKAAETIYRNAIDDLISESKNRTIGRWLFPIGNDFFNIDGSRGLTFAGTPQDTDGRFAKIIEAGEMGVVWAVERLMATAPVDVMLIPGNHDPTTSYHLARFVSAWFRNAKDVTVDAGPSPRKYFAWGSNLIGLTHGNEEKHDQLPNLMATERPSEWAASRCREWLLGHMHRSRQWVTKPVDTFAGVTIRALKSITGTDAWHHRKGYVGAEPGAEAYFYGKSRGYAGHAVVNARMK